MPVPWPPRPREIPSLEKRAITVQQLKDFQLLMQRLCKMRLLKKPNSGGKNIGWHDINMYHIRDQVIKPVVTHLADRDMDIPRAKRARLSWVELVATCHEQSPKLMVSHFWGGRFRDFMAVVDGVVSDRDFSVTDAVWVCTFAHSQFGEDFGPRLKRSPSFHAVQASAEGTVLIIDRDAGSLNRIWCALELFFTTDLDRDLELYTPSGRVGSRLVTSGPLVEAIEGWDVKQCQASELSDRRQILNFLADESIETLGLATNDADGTLVVNAEFRKRLSDTEFVASKSEYRHEAHLFDKYVDRFEALNGKIHARVTRALCLSDSEVSPKSRQPLRLAYARRALTLGQIRTFVKQVKKLLGPDEYKRITTIELGKSVLKQRYNLSSYSEHVLTRGQFGRYLIEHVHDGRFCDTVAGLEWFAEARQLADSDCLFWDLTARRWGDDEEMTRWAAWDHFTPSCNEQHFREAGGAVFVWPDETDITRIWHMDALQICFMSAKLVDICSARGIIACTTPFPDGSWAFGHFEPRIARKVMKLDAAMCQAREPRVTEMVLEGLRKREGGNLTRFNDHLHRIVAGPVLRNAAFVGDVEEVQAVCRCPGLLLNSASMLGSLGETAAHVAAAAGNIQALQALLDLAADPNAEDHIRETPLHYAAFAGQLGCVKLLLSRGANARTESAFAETPLRVAEQNVVGFLGVDTKSICELLMAWEKADLEIARQQHAGNAAASNAAAKADQAAAPEPFRNVEKWSVVD